MGRRRRKGRLPRDPSANPRSVNSVNKDGFFSLRAAENNGHRLNPEVLWLFIQAESLASGGAGGRL